MLGYGRFGGPRTDAADLATIFEFLQRNGLLQPERVLTGELNLDHVLCFETQPEPRVYSECQIPGSCSWGDSGAQAATP